MATNELTQEQDRQELEALREDLEHCVSGFEKAEAGGFKAVGALNYFAERIQQINIRIEFIESRNKGDVG